MRRWEARDGWGGVRAFAEEMDTKSGGTVIILNGKHRYANLAQMKRDYLIMHGAVRWALLKDNPWS